MCSCQHLHEEIQVAQLTEASNLGYVWTENPTATFRQSCEAYLVKADTRPSDNDSSSITKVSLPHAGVSICKVYPRLLHATARIQGK
jgi:hypothetical protein